jgi:hypothetical protein
MAIARPPAGDLVLIAVAVAAVSTAAYSAQRFCGL